jgi:hypothetical protein
VAEFVRVLREEDGNRVKVYSSSFFKPADIKFVAANHAAMVRQHLLSLVPSKHTAQSLHFVDGIAEYLEPSEIQVWLDPFVRTLLSTQVPVAVKAAVRNHLLTATMSTSAKSDESIDSRLNAWVRHLEKTSSTEQVGIIRSLREELESMRVPF